MNPRISQVLILLLAGLGLWRATLKPGIDRRTDVKDSGFSSDGGTRFVVQTRPDGSRAIVLLTSTLIDATGRPLR